MTRKTTAIIDLTALVDNYKQLAALAEHSRLLAVIKADAYGHGAVQVARALDDLAELFAVAFIDEAKALRAKGINTPILSLQGAFDVSECEWAAANNVWLVIHQEQQLRWIDQLENIKPVIWPKLDTGMHRLGFQPEEFAAIVKKYNHLLSEQSVIFTHLASADDPQSAKTSEQLKRLENAMEQQVHEYSIANSAGIIHWQAARQQWNRTGIGMYGGFAGPMSKQLELKPVMTLKAKVIAIRDISKGETVGYGGTWKSIQPSRLATVGIGYADGYPRHAPNGTPAYCNGERIFLTGRVSMDMLIFDVTHLSGIDVGDDVELWGNNLSITDVAEFVGTIDYELMTRLSARVPRKYL